MRGFAPAIAGLILPGSASNLALRKTNFYPLVWEVEGASGEETGEDYECSSPLGQATRHQYLNFTHEAVKAYIAIAPRL